MKQTPVTCEQLTKWSDQYQNCPQRKLATLALAKTALNDVTYVSSAAYQMRQKFSIDIPTLDVTKC